MTRRGYREGGSRVYFAPSFWEDKHKNLLHTAQYIFHGRYLAFPACFYKAIFISSFGRPHRSPLLNFQFYLFALMGAFYRPKAVNKVISIHYSHNINWYVCIVIPQIERETDQKGIQKKFILSACRVSVNTNPIFI